MHMKASTPIPGYEQQLHKWSWCYPSTKSCCHIMCV